MGERGRDGTSGGGGVRARFATSSAALAADTRLGLASTALTVFGARRAAAARAATAAGGGSGVSSTGYANGHVAGAGGGGFNTGPQTHRPQTAGTAATMTRRVSYTTGPSLIHISEPTSPY